MCLNAFILLPDYILLGLDVAEKYSFVATTSNVSLQPLKMCHLLNFYKSGMYFKVQMAHSAWTLSHSLITGELYN